jgi:hypothetical protein
MNQDGRSCPLHYRYRPEAFARDAGLTAETLYVVGGLYGNIESLHAILEMKQQEEQQTGVPVSLFFNGDFNWLNCDSDGFREINETVLRHPALRGNVETELTDPSEGGGCGCNYPDSVDHEVVALSNEIMLHLRPQAEKVPALCRQLAALPMHRTVTVGEQKIGILHGDPESLAGWNFAVEAMPRFNDGCSAHDHSSREKIVEYFSSAQVSAFAATHTGLPFLQDFRVNGRHCLVINNGAAGMPNFAGSAYGLLTRISSCPTAPAGSLYGLTLEKTRFDALPIRYDAAAWKRRFLANWPQGSPAYRAYFTRITQGPNFTVQQAIRIRGDT